MSIPLRDFFNAYADFYRPYLTVVNRILAPYSIHAAQWSVIKRLYLDQPLTVMHLARILGVETPTTTSNIKKLLRLGYIEIGQGRDKREKSLTLSAKGRDVYEKTQPQFDEVYKKLLATVSTDEQDICTKIFSELKANLLCLS